MMSGRETVPGRRNSSANGLRQKRVGYNQRRQPRECGGAECMRCKGVGPLGNGKDLCFNFGRR